MSPKKAILILIIATSIISAIFVILCYNSSCRRVFNETGGEKQTSEQKQLENNATGPAMQQIEKKTQQKINAIADDVQNKNEYGGFTPEAQQKLDDAVNEEIKTKLQLRTPEQEEADKKRKEQLRKEEEEINKKIQESLK